MSKAFAEELDQLIRARYSILYLVTWEEDRAIQILSIIASRQKKALLEWSITEGLHRIQPGPEHHEGKTGAHREPMSALNEILQSNSEALYVLKDFHLYMEAPEVIRQLRDLSLALRRTRKTVIILSPILKLPSELEKSATIVDMPLPSYSDLNNLLERTVMAPSSTRQYRVQLTPQERDTLVKAVQGLTLTEAENAFARAIVRDSKLTGDDIDAVADEKRQVIRKSGVLDYYDSRESMASVGGMDMLKDWLNKRSRAFTNEARKYGLPSPRGILLLGVQGCGKSLVAKAIASTWHFPLLRLDMSRIFEGYIGSSEQNMRKAIQIAETIAPVVLWIDEIEKAFAGVSGSGDSDSGTTARVVGLFLTWMQEKTRPVFIVATANDIQGLPPELMRKGRLDEIFFVDLPRAEDRVEILSIHLKKCGRDPAKFDLEALAEATKGYSGSEIEQAIYSALHDSFSEDREVKSADFLHALNESIPLSVTMRERITTLRNWSRDRARPVSSHQLETLD